MLRSLFRGLIYIAGILFLGSFILQTFPETRGVLGAAKDQVSFFYSLSLDKYGFIGTFVIILAVIFLVSGKK
ncbi:hypothetical protein ACPOM7_17470 [Peribacillus castrilensis]|uniref:hypothetical protein n=1 Tax=Bacillaceae TaxID=186817 RepID=UPI00065FE187|nr:MULTISPECIES: hypothetical protein [Bacillaceae]MCT1390127.1 hypothetical protein [Peribacillus frigoritolerans]NCT39982.1 hypothetical protein [Peribacillus frigoritolerans]PRA81594.1 hypothetical protein CQ056_20560 [Peribacillus simplex]